VASAGGSRGARLAVDVRALARRYRRALKAAGLDTAHRFHDLPQTFGTAAAGVPMRTLQEWMGHRRLSTTHLYADYAPSPHEATMVARAFERGSRFGFRSERI
jgi:integrase